MRYVYIIIQHDWDWQSIRHVFSSRVVAQEFCNKHPRSQLEWEMHEVKQAFPDAV